MASVKMYIKMSTFLYLLLTLLIEIVLMAVYYMSQTKNITEVNILCKIWGEEVLSALVFLTYHNLQLPYWFCLHFFGFLDIFFFIFGIILVLRLASSLFLYSSSLLLSPSFFGPCYLSSSSFLKLSSFLGSSSFLGVLQKS